MLDAIVPEQVPAAILRLTARLLAAPAAPTIELVDEVLTPAEAAAILKTDVRFIYRHSRELGATRLSRRKLRLSRRRVLRYLEARR